MHPLSPHPIFRFLLYISLIFSIFFQPSVESSHPPASVFIKKQLSAAVKAAPLDSQAAASLPTPAATPQTVANTPVDTGLQDFVNEVYTGENGVVRGVYVPGVFAYPIIQQPQNNDIFVSNKSDLLTQFHLAEQNGITGLLAHNFLSGSAFYKLDLGQDIWIVYGDKELKRYQVVSTHQFQKVEPSNLYSHLIDLNTQAELTVSEVYSQFYRGPHHLVFQTCLAGEGRLDWGLFFVMAVPVPN